MPAFWSLPNLFLAEAAAAGSIGLINSVGNLGGFLGPTIMGKVETLTGSYAGGLYYLCGSMLVAATIVFKLGLGAKKEA
jgi:ACS family tartrate transporter-like MFS transporter